MAIIYQEGQRGKMCTNFPNVEACFWNKHPTACSQLGVQLPTYFSLHMITRKINFFWHLENPAFLRDPGIGIMKDKSLLALVPKLCDERFNKDKSLLDLKDKCLPEEMLQGKGLTQRLSAYSIS